MRNSIANGNGDSRYMKSAIPENITHEELVALLREGMFPFDFNGINRDGFAQLGQGLTKENLLDDNTEVIIWGDAADRTVNQALLKLALSVYAGEGMVVNVTVQNDAGEPFEGVTIDGLFDSSANVMVTDAEGKTTGYTTSTSATLNISGFYDLEDTTVTVNGDRGSVQDVTITVKRRNFLSITSTQTKMFSPFCKRVDVTAVGGGGGGGSGYATQYSPRQKVQGQGGAGGYVTVEEDVSFTPFTPHNAIIGAGGTSVYNGSGKQGGTSSFLGVSAEGGGGGIGGSGQTSNVTSNNTAGNGYGGAAKSPGGAGTQQGYISFTEMGAFGGGGGGGYGNTSSTSNIQIGGSPYGGKGAILWCYGESSYGKYEATGGTGPGGGGGGGAGDYYSNSSSDHDSMYISGASGYRGVVNIRMWFEEDLAA